MTPLLFIGVALAGGFGAATRLIFDGVLRTRIGGAFAWGTLAINITGSFALGLVTGLASATVLSVAAQVVIGTGFLGGYTTFSTASFETVRLLQARKWLSATVNGLGVVVLATAAAGLGLFCGAAI